MLVVRSCCSKLQVPWNLNVITNRRSNCSFMQRKQRPKKTEVVLTVGIAGAPNSLIISL